MTSARTLAVLGGLAAAGAAVGAAVYAGLVLLSVPVFPVAWTFVDLGDVLPVAALTGAAYGGLLVPAASFAFMRRVPIWRLFAETTAAAFVGGAIGMVWFTDLTSMAVLSGAGFLAAGARLAWRFRGQPELPGVEASATLPREGVDA